VCVSLVFASLWHNWRCNKKLNVWDIT